MHAEAGSRKIVIATNVAETSITIDSINYVVDPGFVKNAYDSKLGMDSLIITPTSKAQACQRMGRVGWTGLGRCHRLYIEAAYIYKIMLYPVPEIQRTNLAITVLALQGMGINDLINFDFMDPPPIDAFDDSEGLLTRLGRKMAAIPIEPPSAKTLILSKDLHRSEEILLIVSMLGVQNVLYRPMEKQVLAYIMTTKEYMQVVTAIEPKRLTEAAPTFFKVADVNKFSRCKKQEKIEPLYNRYEKPNEWRLTRRKAGNRILQTFYEDTCATFYLF
ncbi:DEAH-box ATP-dependent RNA helicase prp22 [Linnemannia zychae]|nr:DEAH-box ATP-dependent RNA helicase prp22 [Linnemannia zychae]